MECCQVELATGEFPYKNCRNDFEMLAKILDEDPPLLPLGQGFSMDFCDFVCRWYVDFSLVRMKRGLGCLLLLMPCRFR